MLLRAEPAPHRGERRVGHICRPAADLAIEVDISPPDLAKEPIYAALGVPEVWRYDGRRIVVLIKTVAGTYVEAGQSVALPTFPMEDFNRFLQIGLEKRQHAAVEALRQWLRDRRPAP